MAIFIIEFACHGNPSHFVYFSYYSTGKSLFQRKPYRFNTHKICGEKLLESWIFCEIVAFFRRLGYTDYE
jgi:hypothetical protein